MRCKTILKMKYQNYAPVAVRLGLGIVFLWFGISQLVNPESFLGYIPQWLYNHPEQMMHEHPLQLMHSIEKPSVHFILMANGIFETIFGFLLLLGLFTRLSAMILALHLILIMLGMGYNDIAVRDFGLAIAAFSVFLHGPDRWSLELKRSIIYSKN